MILEVFQWLLVAVLVLNLWVTWRAIRDDLATPLQRVAHVIAIWSLPVLGALLILHLQRQHPERATGRYRDVPDAGDELGTPGGYRGSRPAMGDGHADPD